MNGQAEQRAEFGAAVTRLRLERGWSQDRLGEELARWAAVHLDRRDVQPPRRQTVSRWERGECFPDAFNGYLLCQVSRKDPEDLHLHQVVTTQVVARYQRTGSLVPWRTGVEGSIGGPPHEIHQLDWERLSYVLRTMRQVDARLVEDQWKLTQRYQVDRRHLRGRHLLELVVEHVARLRQLRSQTTDERLQRELSIMLGETLILAGGLWNGLTDFGMAVQANRAAAAIGAELDEHWLRITGLLSQAQLAGIHATVPWTTHARLALMEETKASAVGASPHVRVWYHATCAQIHGLLGQPKEAERALELAGRAQALVPPGTGYYFVACDDIYLPIQQGSVALMAGRPREAATLFRHAFDAVEEDVIPIRAWAAVYVAHAEVAAGDFGTAGPSLVLAGGLVDQLDCPLLEHSVARIAAQAPWAGDKYPFRHFRHQLDMNS